MDETSTQEQREKYKSILPSINFLIDSHYKNIIQNEKLIDNKLNDLKINLNIKMKKECYSSYDYLIKRKLIFEHQQSAQTDLTDLTDQTNENDFSLFSFQFVNIKNAEEKERAKEFMDCVSQMSSNANSLIERMNGKHDLIGGYVKKCKSLCIFSKLKKNEDVKENEMVSCLEGCLKKVGTAHQEYTKEYLDNLNNIKF